MKYNKLFYLEDGVSSIEYALIAVLVALAIIGGLEILGPGVGYLFNNVADKAANVFQK